MDAKTRQQQQRQQAIARQRQIIDSRSQSSRVTIGDRRPEDARYEYRDERGGLGYGHKIGNAQTQPGDRVEAITDTHGRVSLNTPAAVADKSGGLTVADDPLNLGRCRGYLRGQLWRCPDVVTEEPITSIVMVGTGAPSLVQQGAGVGRFLALGSLLVRDGEWVEGALPDWTEATAIYPIQDDIERGLFVAIPDTLTGNVRGIAAKEGVTLAISDQSPYDLIAVQNTLNQSRRWMPIVYSEDDGQTWENPKIENTAYARAIADGFSAPVGWRMGAIACIDGRFYAVGSHQQICISDDGRAWTCNYGQFISIANPEGVLAFGAIAGEGDRVVIAGYLIAVTADRGQTWTETYRPQGLFGILEQYRQLLLFDGRYFAFGVKTLNTGRFFPSLLVSEDGGETWAGLELVNLLSETGQGGFVDGAIGAGLVVSILAEGAVSDRPALAVVEYSDLAIPARWRTIDNPFTGVNEGPQRIRFITTLGQFLLISNLGTPALFNSPDSIEPLTTVEGLRSPLVIYEALL